MKISVISPMVYDDQRKYHRKYSKVGMKIGLERFVGISTRIHG
jgi:hypothetical protein